MKTYTYIFVCWSLLQYGRRCASFMYNVYIGPSGKNLAGIKPNHSTFFRLCFSEMLSAFLSYSMSKNFGRISICVESIWGSLYCMQSLIILKTQPMDKMQQLTGFSCNNSNKNIGWIERSIVSDAEKWGRWERETENEINRETTQTGNGI